MSQPWRPTPLATIDPGTQDQPFFTGVSYHREVINRDATDTYSRDYPPKSRFELRIGTQVFTAPTVGDRAVFDIPAAATQSIPDNTPWSLVFITATAVTETIASGHTVRLTPCCP